MTAPTYRVRGPVDPRHPGPRPSGGRALPPHGHPGPAAHPRRAPRAVAALALVAAATLAPADTTPAATGAPLRPPRPHTETDRRAALEVVRAFWAWIGYEPDDPSGCAWAPLIRRTFPDWPDAVGVAWRESRCQPDAQNPSSSAAGLFQILRGTWAGVGQAPYRAPMPCAWADRYAPLCNVAAARNLADAAGFSPWATR